MPTTTRWSGCSRRPATRWRAARPSCASRAGSTRTRTTRTTARSSIALKGEFPQLHIHAFSPEEIDFGHRKSGMPLADYLRWLVDAGLGTMPGTAAEILDDSVRQIVSPRKLKRDRWVEIVRAAHSIGLRSTSTLMYGHIEQVSHVAQHLALLREIQKQTGGFTEFVPLGFIHERNVLFNHMGARAGSSMPEDVRLVAVARLFLRPVDHEHPGVVGEDGAEARAARPDVRAPTTSAAR